SKTLRAKIDMAHGNMNMRDPIMYRIIHEPPHHRTGKKWCIYPMYDWAQGQNDAMHGVTHSLCSIEYEDHRILYEWFLKELVITSINKQAIVIDVMKDKRKLVLQAGSMRTTVPEAQVRKLTEEELNSYQTRAMQFSGTREPALPFVPMKIDLHGSRVDEALEKLDKYIDVAYLSGLSFVYIVHGKGSGVLRKQIHEFLKTLPSIDHFSFSSPEEGGDGVTIAYFK
ncbi:MAG TPA: Smr/MutS family protein, partial [Candidatus Cryosericum sp.]